MELASYVVKSRDGHVVGYIDRQGEDSRFTDARNDNRVTSFFPWSNVLDWARENQYTLIDKSVSEPVAVIGE